MGFSRKQVISTNYVGLCVQKCKLSPLQEHLTQLEVQELLVLGSRGGLSGRTLGHLCACVPVGVLLGVSSWRWPYGCPWARSLVLKNMEFRLEGTLGLNVECDFCLGLVGEHFQYGQ